MWLSWAKTGFTDSSVNVDFRVRLRPKPQVTSFTFINEVDNPNYNWLNLYF